MWAGGAWARAWGPGGGRTVIRVLRSRRAVGRFGPRTWFSACRRPGSMWSVVCRDGKSGAVVDPWPGASRSAEGMFWRPRDCPSRSNGPTDLNRAWLDVPPPRRQSWAGIPMPRPRRRPVGPAINVIVGFGNQSTEPPRTPPEACGFRRTSIRDRSWEGTPGQRLWYWSEQNAHAAPCDA